LFESLSQFSGAAAVSSDEQTSSRANPDDVGERFHESLYVVELFMAPYADDHLVVHPEPKLFPKIGALGSEDFLVDTPWELNETPGFCSQSDGLLPNRVVIDEYRVCICEHLCRLRVLLFGVLDIRH
jgi:hypothetical protein